MVTLSYDLPVDVMVNIYKMSSYKVLYEATSSQLFIPGLLKCFM